MTDKRARAWKSGVAAYWALVAAAAVFGTWLIVSTLF